MGIGVYGSDFDGRGGTFLVAGPLATDEDYEAFRKACVDDESDLLDRETWAQQEYDDANQRIMDVATRAAKRLGLGATTRRNFTSARVAFDEAISSLASDDAVEVGWRSWSPDFVIAVGPTASASQRLDMDGEQAASELGRSAEGFKADYEALAALVQEGILIEMMEDGLDCSYRTSGYTTAPYDKRPDASARLEAIAGSVAALRARLAMGREEAFLALDDAERSAVLNAALDGRDADVAIPVAVKTRDGQRIELYAPPTDDDGWRPAGKVDVTAEIAPWFDGLDAGAFVAIPRNDATAAWFRARQTSPRERNLLVSAEEVAAATGEDVTVTVPMSETDPGLVTQVVVASAPAPGPRP